jgi:hypothetical protein
MSLSKHYNAAKAGLMGINPVHATEHAERLLIAGGTGLALGLISAGMGGLDHKVMGMNVPVDGLASLGLSVAGLAMHSPELLTASVAAAGSASTRSFEAIFKKGLGAHGDFDSSDIPFGFGGNEAPQMGAGYGFGAPQMGQGQFSAGFGFDSSRDRLVEAAKALNAA